MPQGTPASQPASENGEPHAVPDGEKVLDPHFAMNVDAAAAVPPSTQKRLSAADGSSVDLVRTASGVFETAEQIASNNIASIEAAANGSGTPGIQFVPLLKSEFDEVRESLQRAVEDVREPLTRVALGMLIHDQISLARRKIAENPMQFDSLIDNVFESVDREAYTLLSNLPVVIDDYSQIEGLLPAFLEVAAKHYDNAVQLVMKMEKKVGTSLGVFQKFLLNILGTIGKRFPVWIDTTALGNRINSFLSSNDLHRDDKPSFDAYCRHHRQEAGRYKGAKILFMTYASLWESMMPSIADRKMMDWLFARIEEAHRKLSETIDSMDFKKKDKLKELWQQNLAYIRSSFDEALKDAKTIDLPLQRISIASAVSSPVQSSAPSTKEKDYSLALTKSSLIAGCDIAFLEMERSIRQSIPDQNLAGEVTKELRAYLFGTVLPQLPEHINEMNFPSLEPLMDLALGVRPFLHAAGLRGYADRVQEKPDAGSLQTFELMGRDTEAAVAEACAMFLRPLLEVIDRKLEIDTIELKDFLKITSRSFDVISPHLEFGAVDPLERQIALKLRQPEIRKWKQLVHDLDRFFPMLLKDNLARINPMMAAKILDVFDAAHEIQIEEFTSIVSENGRKAMEVFEARKHSSAIELEDAFPKQEVAVKEAGAPKTQASTKEAEQSVPSSINKEDLKLACDAVLEEVAEGLKRFYPNWKDNRDYESTLGIARTSVRDILAECPETLDRKSWNKMEHLIGSAFDFAPFLSGLYVSLSAQQKILDDDNTINVSSRGAELAFKESEFVTHAFLVLLQNLQERLQIPTISADQLRHFFAETRLCKPHETASPAPSATRVKLARFVSRMLAALPGRIDRLMAQKIADTIARAEGVDADAMPDMSATLLRTFKDVDQTRHALDKQSLDQLFRTVMFLNEGANAKKNFEQLPETKSMPREEFERLCHRMGDEIFAAVSSQFTLDPTVFDPYSIRSSVDLILKQCPEVITQENYGELFDFFNYSMPYGILLRKVGLHRNLQKKITPITDEDPDKRLLFCEVQFKQKTREILSVVQKECGVPTIGKEVFKNTLHDFALTQPRAQMAKNLDRNVYKLADFINLFLADLPEELDRRTMTHFISVLYKSEIVGIDLIAGDRDDLHAALKEKLKEAEKSAIAQIDALLQPPQLIEAAPSMTRGEFEALCNQIVTDVFKKVQPAIRTIPIGHPSFLREFAAAFFRGCPERISRDNFDALDALHEGAVPYPALLEAAGIPEDIREKIIGLDIKPYDAGAKEVAQARILETTLSRAAQLIWETVIRRCRVPTMGKLDFQNELPATFTLARRASEQSMDLDTTFHRLAHFATGLLSALPERIDRRLLSRLLDVLANAEEVAIDLMTDEPEMRNAMRAALQESKQKAFVQMDALLESAGPSEAAPSMMTSEKLAEKKTEETSDPETWSTDATLSREVSQDLGVALWNCPLLTRDLLKRKIGDMFSGIFAGDIDKRLGILTKAQRKTELNAVVPLRVAAQRVVSHVTQSDPVQTSESYRMLIGGLGAIIKDCRGAHLRIALTEYLAEAFNATLDGLESMVLEWEAKRGDGGNGNGNADAGSEESTKEQGPDVPETLLKHRQILDALIKANEEAGKVLGVDIKIRKDTSLAAIQSSCPDVILSIANLSNILYANVGRLAYLRSTIQGDDADERFARIQTIFERSMRSLVQHFPDAPDASVLLQSLEYLSQITPQSSAQVDADTVSSKCDEVFSAKIGGKITRGILANAPPVAVRAMEEFVEQTRVLLQQFIHSHLSHGLRSIGELHMLTEFLGSRILHGMISSEASNQLSMQLSKSDRKTLFREFTARLLNRWNSMAHAMFDSVINPAGEPEVVEEAVDAANTDEESSETQDSLPAPDSDDADRSDEETSVDADSTTEVTEESVVAEPTPEPEPIDPLAEAMIASGSANAGDHIGILFDTSLSIHSETLLRGMVHQHSMKDTEEIAAEAERVSDICHDAIATAIAEMTEVGQMPSLAVLRAIAGRAFDLVTTASHDGFVHIGVEQRDALIKEVSASLARPDISAEELLIDVTADTEISEPEKSDDASGVEATTSPADLHKKGIQGAAKQFVDQRVRAEQRQKLERALKQLQVIDEERPNLEAGIAQAFDQLRQSAAGGDITASDTLADFQAIQRTVLQMLLSKLPPR